MSHPASCVALLFGVSLAAQDLIGVNFAGQAFAIDSTTGQGVLLGLTGRVGHNAMSRAGTTLFATEQSTTASGVQFHLDTLNEVTGIASRVSTTTRELRGLAKNRQGELSGITNEAGGDQFVHVQSSTGAITVVGNTGFTQIQALAINPTFLGDVVFAWDLAAGLLRINPQTGVATDVDPAFGTGGVNVQFLTFSRGRLLGGRDALYTIDAGTGVPTLIGGSGFADVRGLEERFGVAVDYGTACGGVTLTATGSFFANSTLTSTSRGHARQAAGALMLGQSNTSFLGIPLPFNLDPLLGTSNCSLLTSADLMVTGSASLLGAMSFSMPIPLFTQGGLFHLQHLALDPAPGGLVFTNGVTVRVHL